ncbi:hypothetical protein ABKN59_008948 [Abortiporus biennis]
MFIVKATYRGETRKFSFDASTFPTYEQLYNQLYRIFRIHNAYYLSKLLFSSESKNSSRRILIGMEAHSAEEYNKHIAPYQGQTWNDALLKFSVHDETPHKSPSTASLNILPAVSSATTSNASEVTEDPSLLSDSSTVMEAPLRSRIEEDRKGFVDRIRERTASRSRPVSYPFLASSSSTASVRLPPLNSLLDLVDSPSFNTSSRPLPTLPALRNVTSSSSLSAASTSTVRPPSPPYNPFVQSAPIIPPPPSLPSDGRGIQSTTVPTLSRRVTLPAPPPPILFPVTESPSRPVTVPDMDDVIMFSPKSTSTNVAPADERSSAQLPAKSAQPARTFPAAGGSIAVDGQADSIKVLKQEIGEVKELVSTLVTDVQKVLKITESQTSSQAESSAASTPGTERIKYPFYQRPYSFIAPPPPPPMFAPPPPVIPPPPPPFVMGPPYHHHHIPPPPPLPPFERFMRRQVHPGITCDVCNATIFGVRFKCFDCEDYDLCSDCMSSPTARGKHSAAHDFWPIKDPNDKDAFYGARMARESERAKKRSDDLREKQVVHPGIKCDSCGQKDITGVRFRCLDCADFDLCSSCMSSSSIREKHDPAHSFWPLENPGMFDTFSNARTKYLAGRATLSSERRVHFGITCDHCQVHNITGVRFKCLQCNDYDLCDTCMALPDVHGGHARGHGFWPVIEPGNLSSWYAARNKLPVHNHVHCDACNVTVTGIRMKCLDCDDYDLCTSCLASPEQRRKHAASHVFFPINTPGDKTGYFAAKKQRPTASPDTASHGSNNPSGTQRSRVIHENVACDQCRRNVEGIRFKCLDCPDFDLCQDCAEMGGKSAHNPFHAFFEIEQPGDVYVHTIFSGDGERVPERNSERNNTRPNFGTSVSQHPSLRRPSPPAPTNLYVHHSICNMCDSRIRGDRFKCLNCPDFDTCSSCFAITSDQHPGHGFVRIKDSDDLLMRDALRNAVTHPATCNFCHNVIHGTRYKCMHPSCPDYDLCQNCEAHPIPVHPSSHPFLKLRTPDSIIPVVQRGPSPREALPWALGRHVDIHPIPEGEVRETSNSDHHPQRPSTPPRIRAAPNCLKPPTVPPRIPDNWTDPESWNPPEQQWPCWPPPGPMIVPNMLASEDTPPFPSILAGPATDEGFFSSEIPLIYRQSPPVQEGLASPLHPQIPTSQSSPTSAHRPMSPPEGQLIDIGEPVDHVMTPLDGSSTLSEAVESGVTSAPRLGPVTTEWRELFPELTTMLKHLLQPTTPPADDIVGSSSMPGDIHIDVTNVETRGASSPSDKEFVTAVEDSPLAGEALLSRPSGSSNRVLGHDALNTLNGLLTKSTEHHDTPSVTNNVATTIPANSDDEVVLARARASLSKAEETLDRAFTSLSKLIPRSSKGDDESATDKSLAEEPLLSRPRAFSNDATVNLRRRLTELLPKPPYVPKATFVSDTNIPDGQIFPPGAEFVKSWRMKNDGTEGWPETTEVVFVAGDRLAPRNDAPKIARVGAVPAGEEVEIVGGEMKAPDVPGKYVSYWRLRDGEGNFFGNSIWVDITVAEMDKPASSSSGEDSLAASSVIMPRSLEDVTPSFPSGDPSARASSLTIPSNPPSDDGSFDSSVSLIDAPMSSDDEDEAIYQDSRSRVLVPPTGNNHDQEYIVLYDTGSSEED